MQRTRHKLYKETDMVERPLSEAGIASVPRGTRGVYVLIDYDDRGAVVAYVRRGNIRSRLHEHVKRKRGIPYFAYREVRSELSAFRQECALYHRYGKRKCLLNRVHPKAPDGYRGKRCTQMGCNGEP